jgi:protein O-GlcNAc transferase
MHPTASPSPEEIRRAATLFQAGAMRELGSAARDLTQRYPGHAAGWVFLGVALESLGHLEHAVAVLRHVVGLLPQRPEHRTHLGSALQALQRYDEAQACYRDALGLDPRHTDTLLRLAQLHTERNELPQAEQAYRRLLDVEPGHGQASFQLGVLGTWQGKWCEAEAAYRAALAAKPDSAMALDALGHALLEQGRANEALACARQAVALAPGSADLLGNLLFTRNYVGSRAPQPAEPARYGALMTAAAVPHTAWRCEPQPQRLRVGLVSGDLRRHAVSTFLPSVLDRSLPSRVDYIAYPTNALEDGVTASLKPFFAGWHPIGALSAAQAAQRVVDDAIHVLVDLSGHSGHGRLDLFAARPAPVQLSWLGYPASTGLAQMDYLLTAPRVSVPGDEAWFTERLWPLPETLFCYAPPSPAVPIGELPATANGCVTFASFNNLTKLSEPVVRAWSRILQAVPESRLYLRAWQLQDDSVRRSVAARFQARGIGGDRLVLKGPIASLAAHLADYNQVDIALDTFPFGGGTTTAEAVYMGVPVVTLHGSDGLLRLGEGVLQALGLQGWVTHTVQAYVDRAVAAAADPGELERLRASLRRRMEATALLDAPRFRAGFEQALWDMWERAAADGKLTAR